MQKRKKRRKQQFSIFSLSPKKNKEKTNKQTSWAEIVAHSGTSEDWAEHHQGIGTLDPDRVSQPGGRTTTMANLLFFFSGKHKAGSNETWRPWPRAWAATEARSICSLRAAAAIVTVYAKIEGSPLLPTRLSAIFFPQSPFPPFAERTVSFNKAASECRDGRGTLAQVDWAVRNGRRLGADDPRAFPFLLLVFLRAGSIFEKNWNLLMGRSVYGYTVLPLVGRV